VGWRASHACHNLVVRWSNNRIPKLFDRVDCHSFCRLDTNAKKNDKPKDQFMKQLALKAPEIGSISLG